MFELPDIIIPECGSPWKNEPGLCPPDGLTFRRAMEWFFENSQDPSIQFFTRDLTTSIPHVTSMVKGLLREYDGGPSLCDKLEARTHDMGVMDAACRLASIESSSIVTRLSRIDEAAELRERVFGHRACLFMTSWFLWYLYGMDPPGTPSPWRDRPEFPSISQLDPYQNMGMRIDLTARRAADALEKVLTTLLGATAPGVVPERDWRQEVENETFGMTDLPRHQAEALARGFIMTCVNSAVRPADCPENLSDKERRSRTGSLGMDPLAAIQAFLEELSRHFRGSLAHRVMLQAWRRMDPPPPAPAPPGEPAFRFASEMQKIMIRHGRMPGDDIAMVQAAHDAMAGVSLALEQSAL